jgi:hypothetical protein
MGRPEEPLERDGSPIREFAFWLRDLRRRSGLTYDQLGKKAHYATSTVQSATAGNRLPTLRVTLAIVRACEGDEAQWREYWNAIRRLLDRGVPAGVSRAVDPPWARAGSHPEAPPAGDQAGGEPGSRPATTELPGPTIVGPGIARPGILASLPGDAAPPAEAGAETADGWFIESFGALLRLDADPVEALEFRSVIATVDGVIELVTSLSVPRAQDAAGGAQDLESELLYGGSLERRGQPYDSFFQNVIVLPRPLRRGGRHEYAMRHRIPAGQRMVPHYVHVPYRRSDRFDLRVRFGASPPAEVWALRDAPTAAIYGRSPSAERLIPDRFGEIQVAFTRLRPGLGYGISWR